MHMHMCAHRHVVHVLEFVVSGVAERGMRERDRERGRETERERQRAGDLVGVRSSG